MTPRFHRHLQRDCENTNDQSHDHKAADQDFARSYKGRAPTARRDPFPHKEAETMTLEEEIAFWQEQSDKATLREIAFVAFGIRWGLQIARDEHFKSSVATQANAFEQDNPVSKP